jgi:heavy metal sensor kinase
MNMRSIRFRLTVWYAAIIALTLTAFCALAYIGLERYMTAELSTQLSNQANQIAQTWLREINASGPDYVVSEIDEHLSPQITNRFIRITRDQGSPLYLPKPPRDDSFDPDQVPLTAVTRAGFRQERPAGKKLLIYSMPVTADGGGAYTVEVGEAYRHVEGTLHGLAGIFIIVLPVALALATGGGYLLIKRALGPVDELSSAAEHITSRNLSERLPVPKTGDEIERLSLTLNKMIERLEGSFRRVTQFTADASHELRTPLTILRGELEVALRRDGGGAQSRDTLESTLEETERLSKTVENLMVLSRLDSGELKLELTEFDLSALCKDTVDQMRLLAEDKSIDMICPSSTSVGVRADLLRIRQILINLIDNAIKYTAAGGRIEILVFREDSTAVIQVTDTGQGIPADAIPFIFDRFYRVDRARSRGTGGSGLGLAIAKSICDLHGGRIVVDSVVGKGTKVRVGIPEVNGRSTAR